MHIIPPELRNIKGVNAAFFSRLGGVSQGDYDSLNCGYGSGDDPHNVKRNRLIASSFLEADMEVFTVSQYHSAQVVLLDKPWDRHEAPQADAIITMEKNLPIGVLTADCVPVLLAEENGKAIAAIHAGWKGTQQGIIQSTINALEEIGIAPEALIASIGPAISGESFEVGAEVKSQFPGYENYFTVKSDKHLFNLKGLVAHLLYLTGVRHITDIGVDTYTNPAQYYSYRRNTHANTSRYGRQLSAIML